MSKLTAQTWKQPSLFEGGALLAGRGSDELLTVSEAAGLLKRSRRWVEMLIADGRLPAENCKDKVTRVRRADLEGLCGVECEEAGAFTRLRGRSPAEQRDEEGYGELMTVWEVAEEMACSRRLVFEMLANGQLTRSGSLVTRRSVERARRLGRVKCAARAAVQSAK